MNKGKIRNGQKKPYTKCTQAEMERRIQRTEELLRTGPILKHELLKKIKREFGVDWRMGEDYIARARSRLILHVAKAKEEHRADSLAWWEGNLLTSATTIQEKQTARKQMDELLGLRVVQLSHSGQIAQSTAVDVSKLGLDTPTLERLLEAIRKKHGSAAK